LTPFAPGTNAPSAKLMATDDGVYSAHLDLMTKVPGGPANALQSRLHISSAGNVGIATTSPGHLLQVGANASPAYCDGTTWVNGSDRDAKSGFHLVDPADALAKVAALPVSYWYYTNDPATPHIGPMAQDFYDAFGVGPDNKHIATVDEGGVALAAIQGLNEKLETLTSELKTRDAEVARLKKENQRLAERLDNLEQTQGALAHHVR
jgi:hypothetical protein